MHNVDLNAKIPNNVDLKNDRKLCRALVTIRLQQQ